MLVLAVAGSELALSSNDKVMTAFESMRYVSVRVLLAVTLTVSVGELVQSSGSLGKAALFDLANCIWDWHG